ncbi:MAG: Rid family hydrolase [Pseudomonadota bacterium]
MSLNIQKVNPPSLPDAPAMGYSQIAVAGPGRQVFMSGQVAWTPDGAPVPESLHDQARIAMGNAIKGLAAIDAGPQNITSIRMYIANPSPEDFYSVAPDLSEFMDGNPTTFTALGVTALGGEELKIELEVTAVI